MIGRVCTATGSSLVLAISLLRFSDAGAADTPAAPLATANAVKAAEDAFGTTLDLQTIGLYSDSDARGFSPIDSGNIRIEGLYFDMKVTNTAATDLDPCWARETNMKVGITAQGYSFPAPSGIADITLNIPTGETQLTTQLTRGPLDASVYLLEGQTKLSERVAAGACAAYYKNFSPDSYAHAGHVSVGVTGLWRPDGQTEVVPFWFNGNGDARGVIPRVYTDGFEPPPLFRSTRLPYEDFTTTGWQQNNIGLIVRRSVGEDWRISAGAFYSQETDSTYFIDQFLSIVPDGTAEHVLDVAPPQRAASSSGEIRITRSFIATEVERDLQLTIRGRHSTQEFGGDAQIDYSAVNIYEPTSWSPMPYTFGALSSDKIDQYGIGMEYSERRAGFGSFGFGLMKTHYERTVALDAGMATTTSTDPLLTDVRFTVEIRKSLVFYASYIQGLEDSALAPDNALNRGEQPPATRSHQVDAGFRYQPTERLSLIGGVFSIDKMYFAIDDTRFYSELGTASHRGIESSFTYSTEAWKLVAGAVWVRERVNRYAPEPGVTGEVPLGSVPLKLQTQLDISPPKWQPWAASINWSWWSARTATWDNEFGLPPYGTLGAGLRYESKFRGTSWSVRLDAMNLLNANGLQISDVGRVTAELQRRYQLTLSIDL